MSKDDDAFDERGILRDGKVARVLMSVRDANTVRGQIAADRQRTVDLAGHDGLALYRPGFRRLPDASAYTEAAKAYEQRIIDGESAWRAGPAQGATYDARGDQSPPADSAWRPGLSLSDAEELKAQAYAARVHDGQEAWKTLGSL